MATRLLNENLTLNISNSDIRNRNRILGFKEHIQQFLFYFKRIAKEVELKDLGLNFDDFT